MRASIRLRLLILVLLPALLVLAFAGQQVLSSLERSQAAQDFSDLVTVAQARYDLVHDLQIERTRTLEAAHLGAPGGMDSTASGLVQARAETDEALAVLRQVRGSSSAPDIPAPDITAVSAFVPQRGDIDSGGLSDQQLQQIYAAPIQALLDADQSLLDGVSQLQIATRLQTASALAHMKAAAVEQADIRLLTATGAIETPAAEARIQALSEQRDLWLQVLGQVADPEEAETAAALAGWDAIDDVEDLADAREMVDTVQAIARENSEYATDLRDLEQQVSATSTQIAQELIGDAQRQLLLVGVLTAVLAALLGLLVLGLSRGIVRPLRRLTGAAAHIAANLHDTVTAAAHGEDADTDALLGAIPAELTTRTDEFGDLARALSGAASEATDVAIEQARTRHGASQTISNVARREQSLVERQLSLLEVMEATEEDPEVLSQLFQLDHLAARMRRNAENLLLLSVGQMPGAGETEHLPLVDVLRSAAAETEDYARVDVRVGLPLDVLSYSATPLSHLLAELIENATNFSPPHTRVAVNARRTDDGVLVTIVDHGLGMSPDDLAEARARLAAPPVMEAAESRQLGLYVVGLLADRMGVAVDMRPGQEDGLEVHVLLPDSIFVATADAVTGPSALAAQVAAGGPASSAAASTAAEIPDFDLHDLDFETPSAPAIPLPSTPAESTPLPSRRRAEPAQGASPPQPIISPTSSPPADEGALAPQAATFSPLDGIDDDPMSAIADLLGSSPQPPVAVPSAHSAGQPALPSRQREGSEVPDDHRSGLSLAAASHGSTVDIDPNQVSALMRSFANGFDDDLPPAPAAAPPPAASAAAAGPTGSGGTPPPTAPGPSSPASVPAASPAGIPAADAAPVPPAAASHPNPMQYPAQPSRRTSSWSTPFEPKDKR